LKLPTVIVPTRAAPRNSFPETFDNLFILNHSDLPSGVITLRVEKSRKSQSERFFIQQDFSLGDCRLVIQTEKEYFMKEQRKVIQGICDQAVDEMFVEHNEFTPVQPEPKIGMFTLSGKAKDTKIVAHWISRITAGMPIAEAAAVIATNPVLIKNIQEIFPDVKITFNIPGIKKVINKKVE
jgi:hypothetical protein